MRKLHVLAVLSSLAFASAAAAQNGPVVKLDPADAAKFSAPQAPTPSPSSIAAAYETGPSTLVPVSAPSAVQGIPPKPPMPERFAPYLGPGQEWRCYALPRPYPYTKGLMGRECGNFEPAAGDWRESTDSHYRFRPVWYDAHENIFLRVPAVYVPPAETSSSRPKHDFEQSVEVSRTPTGAKVTQTEDVSWGMVLKSVVAQSAPVAVDALALGVGNRIAGYGNYSFGLGSGYNRSYLGLPGDRPSAGGLFIRPQ